MNPARVLLVGAGEVGGKHLAALASTPSVEVVGVADPCPRVWPLPGVPLFASWKAGLAALRPELVVVAAPPGIALRAARDAARAGATVLVEKPATLDPAAASPRMGDERIFVALQSHFAPGVDRLLTALPVVDRAEVTLAVRRDADYFRGWRSRFATAGGVLHQQAIHGLALALRLLPNSVARVEAETFSLRGLAEMEDRVVAEVLLSGGARLSVDARTDFPGSPRHEVRLHVTDRQVAVRGRNLEAGLGDPQSAPSHEELRRRMYAAALDVAAGRPPHPCLFPLRALPRLLEVINRVYRAADHRVAVA